MKTTPTLTVVLCAVFALLFLGAILLPKLAAGNEQGMAGAATAALTFLVIAGLAALVAIFLFIATLMSRRTLPGPVMILGLIPLPLCFAGGFYFMWLVVQRAQ